MELKRKGVSVRICLQLLPLSLVTRDCNDDGALGQITWHDDEHQLSCEVSDRLSDGIGWCV